MSKRLAATLCAGALALTTAAPGAPAQLSPGDRLPELVSDHRLASGDRKYLGIQKRSWRLFGRKTFSVRDIPAEVLVIEFFNRYCTTCQAQAPILNTVFEDISAQADLAARIKFIGIGAGNTAEEVARFRIDKSIAFPLLPDPDFSLYDAIGDPGGTPFTLIVKAGSPAPVVVSATMGLISDAGQFAAEIRAALSTPTPDDTHAEPMPSPDKDPRMLHLAMPEPDLQRIVKKSMRAAAGSTPISSVAKLRLPSGREFYRCSIVRDPDARLYSVVISRKPVCDVCHGIHFILTFDRRGVIADFTPLHVTKYGNIPWHDYDVAYMRKKLLGISLENGYTFTPEVDAVSMATMSSALVFNSVNRLQDLWREIRRAGL